MIAITTNSSMSVNPRREFGLSTGCRIGNLGFQSAVSGVGTGKGFLINIVRSSRP
jgi:hypothetical protein